MYDVILRHYNDAGDGANSRDYVIHSYKTPNDHSRKLINPNLDIEENTAGTLKFTVPPGNAGNGYAGEPDITMGTDEIIIRRTVVRSIQTLANGVLQVHITILEGKLSAQFSASVNGTLDINWGDNSIHYTMTGSSIATSKTITHPYSTAGNYVLTLTPSTGTLFNFVNMATEFWRGFPETSTKDFYNNVEYTCLGELAYLSDTVQEKKTYNYNTQDAYEHYPEHYLTALIAIHNAHCGHKKRFIVGQVTVTAENKASKAINRTAEAKFETTPSQTTFECIQNLISNCGGHLEIRWDYSEDLQETVRYLDYLKDYAAPGSSGVPIVQFATNLIDYTRETDLSDLITVLYPYGQTTNEVDSEGKLVKDPEGNTIRKTVDITSVNNGKPYIEYTGDSEHPQNYLAMYGRHEASVTFSNVADASNLLKLAKLYLYNQPFVYEVLSCKAVDMIYAPESTSTAPIDYLKKVKVKSIPHGTDENGREFVVTKLSLPIDTPEETIYSMSTGSRKTQQISTSVKDHDDKQKDTDDDIGDIGDTVDDIGGGGEEITTGKDGKTGWVIGLPRICKEKKSTEGSAYLAKADHLKLWYDTSGTLDKIFDPVTVKRVGSVEGAPALVDDTVGLEIPATGEHPKIYVTINKYRRGCACYGWYPSFVSDELKVIDDPASYASELPNGSIYGYAHIKGSNGLPIIAYYTGPNGYDIGRNDLEGIPPVCKLNTGNMYQMQCGLTPQAPSQQTARVNWGGNEMTGESDFYAPNSPAYRGTKPPYPLRGMDTITPPGDYTSGRCFSPWTVGVMPLPQRPFYSSGGATGNKSEKTIVVYMVANMAWGFPEDSNQGYICGGGIGVYHSGSNGSGGKYINPVNTANSTGECPAGIYNGGTRKVALYNIERIKSRIHDLTADSPEFILAPGNYIAYAWVRHVSGGKTYPFSSDVTGGLFLHYKGETYTGCEKWTEGYNALLPPTFSQYYTAEQLPTASDARKQYLTINGNPTFEDSAPSYNVGGRTVLDPDADTIVGTLADTYAVNSGIISIKAIGYCLSAYGQITTDEVVENLRFIYNKYGG